MWPIGYSTKMSSGKENALGIIAEEGDVTEIPTPSGIDTAEKSPMGEIRHDRRLVVGSIAGRR